MTEKTVQYQGLSVYYTVSGAGEPVVLVHGLGEDGQIWKGLSTALEKDHQLIVPDIPGSGRSAGLPTEPTIDALAESLKPVLDQEGITRCTMIGHSMGGCIALAFAERYPALVGRLGLFHATSFADSDERKETRKKNIDLIHREGAAKFIEQSTPNLFSPESRGHHPALVAETVQRYTSFSPASLVYYTMAMMNRPERTAVLTRFAGPVLFIMGEYDKAVPLEQSLRECHLPGISYIYVCTHSAHLGMLEEPEFCAGAVAYFLSGK